MRMGGGEGIYLPSTHKEDCARNKATANALGEFRRAAYCVRPGGTGGPRAKDAALGEAGFLPKRPYLRGNFRPLSGEGI